MAHSGKTSGGLSIALSRRKRGFESPRERHDFKDLGPMTPRPVDVKIQDEVLKIRERACNTSDASDCWRGLLFADVSTLPENLFKRVGFSDIHAR
jgi:hypothetical protein